MPPKEPSVIPIGYLPTLFYLKGAIRVQVVPLKSQNHSKRPPTNDIPYHTYTSWYH